MEIPRLRSARRLAPRVSFLHLGDGPFEGDFTMLIVLL